VQLLPAVISASHIFMCGTDAARLFG